MDCDRIVLIDNVWLDIGELPALPVPKLISDSVLVSESITVPEPMMIAENTNQTIVETVAIIDCPTGLESFPLVTAVWNYLDGKDARTIKQIRDALRKSERITEDDLKAKFPNVEGYSEGLKNVINFGVNKGFLKEVSEDTYEAIKKH